MSEVYARVEAVVNLVLCKPVAAFVFGILVGTRWTVKRIAKLLSRVHCTTCTKPVGVMHR